MDEIARSFHIRKKIYSVYEIKKEEGSRENTLIISKREGLRSLLQRPYDLKFLKLDQDDNAKAAMMRAFAAYLIENIRDIGQPAAKLKLSSGF